MALKASFTLRTWRKHKDEEYEATVRWHEDNEYGPYTITIEDERGNEFGRETFRAYKDAVAHVRWRLSDTAEDALRPEDE